MARVVVHPGRQDERSYELDPERPLRIGRGDDNDVAVLHKSLSRHHAVIEAQGRTYRIRDLGSHNGTRVHQEAITTAWLKDGDRIACGDVLLVFHADAVESPRTTVFDPKLLSRTFDQFLEQGASTARGDPELRLSLLLKAAETLAVPSSIEALLDRVATLALQVIDADRLVVVLSEDGGGSREALVRSRLPRELGSATYSRTVVDTVRLSGQAMLVHDAQDDRRLDEAASIVLQDIRTVMAAPLLGRGGPTGVLYVDRQGDPMAWTERELEFLAAFAIQAGLAVENARLRQRIEQDAIARNNLERFFPPSTLSQILQAKNVDLAPRETVVTALFCDIKDFTGLAQRVRPLRVVEILNAFFPRMASIVFDHGGTLEKYIGDALLAVWGAPFAQDDDQARALAAARAMMRAMPELRAATGTELGIHIGLHTGPVAAGNVGSPHYLQYATIGDTTNVAARLCGVAKEGEILATAATMDALTDPDRVALGPVTLRGRAEPVTTWRVLW